MIDHKTAYTNDGGDRGLYVAAVSYNNGFQVGDRIVAVNGTRVTTGGQIRALIAKGQVGDVMEVGVVRNGDALTVSVTLSEADAPGSNSEQVA